MTYKTKDRFEIYVLLAKKYDVAGFETEGKLVYFYFSNQTKCKKIISLLLSKKLTVFAHEMIDAIRMAQTIFITR